jgi:y4mF family transcriptional regulator
MKNKLSEFIKKRRKQAKLTQEAIALKAGVGLRFIRDLEQGKTSLRLDKVNQVLDLFGQEVGPVIKLAVNENTKSTKRPS